MKMTLSPEGSLSGEIAGINLVRNDFVPELSFELETPVKGGQLIINLRAEAAPDVLGTAVREGLARRRKKFPTLKATVDHLEHFRPGNRRPRIESKSYRRSRSRHEQNPKWFTGEFFGTFLLVFFGCGSVCAAVLTGAQVGVFQVAIVWGLGIATAIYLTAALSGAHLNPAVTLSMAVWSDFPKGRVIPYIATQMAGAFVASAVLFYIFGNALTTFEATNGIVRGAPGSEASAMIFGEYYPSPGGRPFTTESRKRMTTPRAFAAEVVGTGCVVAR
jgi:hypothetical protein